MVPHKESDESYVAITSNNDGDCILFYHEGGATPATWTRKPAVAGTNRHMPTAVEIEKALGQVPRARFAPVSSRACSFYADLNRHRKSTLSL